MLRLIFVTDVLIASMTRCRPTTRDAWVEVSVYILPQTRHGGRRPSVPHVILAFTLFLDVQINLTMSGLVEINYSNQTHTHELLTGTLGVPVNSINWCSHSVTMNLNLNQFSRTNTLSPPARVANLSFCRHVKNSLNTKLPGTNPQAKPSPVLVNVI